MILCHCQFLGLSIYSWAIHRTFLGCLFPNYLELKGKCAKRMNDSFDLKDKSENDSFVHFGTTVLPLCLPHFSISIASSRN